MLLYCKITREVLVLCPMMWLRVNIIRKRNVIENEFWVNLPRGSLGFVLRRIEIRFFTDEWITFVVILFYFGVYDFLLRRMMSFRKSAKHRDRLVPHDLRIPTVKIVVFLFRINAIHVYYTNIWWTACGSYVLLRHSFAMYNYWSIVKN